MTSGLLVVVIFILLDLENKIIKINKIIKKNDKTTNDKQVLNNNIINKYCIITSEEDMLFNNRIYVIELDDEWLYFKQEKKTETIYQYIRVDNISRIEIDETK